MQNVDKYLWASSLMSVIFSHAQKAEIEKILHLLDFVTDQVVLQHFIGHLL